MTNSDTSSSNFDNFRNPDEVKLIERVVSADNKAIEQLFEKYKEMVLGISKRYVNREVSTELRINVGNQGLLKAATRFHDTKGINFIAYAIWWIRESILENPKD